MSEEKKNKLTQEGYNELLDKLEKLNEAAKENLAVLKEARAQGDLSENADYDAACKRKDQLDAEIARLTFILKNAEIVGGKSGNATFVGFSTYVKFLDKDENQEYVYQIVSTHESNVDDGKISEECPLGKALMNHKVGDTVKVMAKVPYEVVIKQISYEKI